MRRLAALAALALALALVGCNKGPARQALAEADQQLAATRQTLELYAPEKLAAIRAQRREADAQLTAGHYTEALKLAQQLPGRIDEAAAVAKARHDELTAAWTPIAGRVPLILEGASRRAEAEPATPPLPRGMDPGQLEELRSELRDIRDGWERATRLYDSGQVAGALDSGRELQKRLEAAAARLGLSPAAAMAVAAAPSPSPPASPSPSASPAAATPRAPRATATPPVQP
jgi:hypothetical protein